MIQPVTLAHLSDIHLPFSGGLTFDCMNVKRVLGWLNWHRKRRFIHQSWAVAEIVADVKAMAPDHILISGDLVNIGLPAEYAAARDWLERLGPADGVSVVPGNHDAYVAREAIPGIALWSRYMESDAFGKRLAGPGSEFPYVRRIGPVAIVGVNSGIETSPGSAIGEVGKPQLKRLAAILDRLGDMELVRLVMIHHPPVPGLAPPRRALRDADDLASVLARHGAELAIHGHNHTMTSVTRGHTAIEGVASASAGRQYSDEPAARYNLLRIKPADAVPAVRIEIETRGLDPAGTGVMKIASRTLEVHIGSSQFQDKGCAP